MHVFVLPACLCSDAIWRGGGLDVTPWIRVVDRGPEESIVVETAGCAKAALGSYMLSRRKQIGYGTPDAAVLGIPTWSED